MFLALLANPLPWALSTLSNLMRQRSLSVHLPIMAIQWFDELDRITGGLIKPRFNPEEVINSIRTGKHTTESRTAVIMNAKWNIIWSKYCIDILTMAYPVMVYGFKNVIKYNTNFLEDRDEPEPSISVQPIEKSGNMGFDLISGDLVANSYVDTVWGTLVDGLDSLTSFRNNYVQATRTPGYVDENTALIAKAIALAEISWSNEFFPFRDVSDMWLFEYMWRIRFGTGMMSNFIRAANLVGAGLPDLSSREIIKLVGRNPDTPIEELII